MNIAAKFTLVVVDFHIDDSGGAETDAHLGAFSA
jgi:hypothetical protein